MFGFFFKDFYLKFCPNEKTHCSSLSHMLCHGFTRELISALKVDLDLVGITFHHLIFYTSLLEGYTHVHLKECQIILGFFSIFPLHHIINHNHFWRINADTCGLL